jgi:hypothetical protein
MTSLRTSATALVLSFLALPAFAQELDREPIGRFVADARVAFPNFPDDGSIATGLGVTNENLPGRGLGLAVGLHVYPARMGRLTLGLGGELLISGASKTLEPATEGGPDGPTVSGRFTALSPQLSLNFGGRDGWSYVSGGIGWASLTIENEAAPVADADGRLRAINYGGGARWFPKPHLAFSFDLRFYRYGAQEAIVRRPAYPGGRMLVMSAGVSVK